MRPLYFATAAGPAQRFPGSSAPRIRMALVTALTAIFLFASAMRLGPAVAQSAAPGSPAALCHCAHCPGGAACCCHGLASCAIHH